MWDNFNFMTLNCGNLSESEGLIKKKILITFGFDISTLEQDTRLIFVPKKIIVSEALIHDFTDSVLIYLEESSYLELWIKSSMKKILIFVNNHASLNILGTANGEYEAFLNSNCNCQFNLAPRDGENIFFLSKVTGNNSQSDINCLILGEKKSAIRVTNSFEGKNNRGFLNIGSAAIKSARQRIDGLISIGKNASQTESYLKINSLVLGGNAKVEVLPKLEINTNDVKAGHGAAISRINDEELFYLMSRGLSEVQAKKLILDGLVEAFLDRAKLSDTIKQEFRSLQK